MTRISNRTNPAHRLNCARILKKATKVITARLPGSLGAGGPDDFGYVWIDSDESRRTYLQLDRHYMPQGLHYRPPPWVMMVKLDLTMGFNFEFYGEVQNQFWVASNGAVGFTQLILLYTNTGIPTNSSVNVDFIAMFWDDLYSTYAPAAGHYQNFADYPIVRMMPR